MGCLVGDLHPCLSVRCTCFLSVATNVVTPTVKRGKINAVEGDADLFFGVGESPPKSAYNNSTYCRVNRPKHGARQLEPSFFIPTAVLCRNRQPCGSCDCGKGTIKHRHHLVFVGFTDTINEEGATEILVGFTLCFYKSLPGSML